MRFFLFIFSFIFFLCYSFGAVPSGYTFVNSYSTETSFSYENRISPYNYSLISFINNFDPSKYYYIEFTYSFVSGDGSSGWTLANVNDCIGHTGYWSGNSYKPGQITVQPYGGAETTLYGGFVFNNTFSYSGSCVYTPSLATGIYFRFWYYRGCQLSFNFYVSSEPPDPENPGTGGGEGGEGGEGEEGGEDEGGTTPDYPEVHFPDPPSAPDPDSQSSKDVKSVIQDLSNVKVQVPESSNFVYPVWTIATPSAGSFSLDFAQGFKNSQISGAIEKLSTYVKSICFFFISVFFFIKVFHLFRKNS